MKDPLDKISDLEIGKAGEYLVCADLIMNGYHAFLGGQGLPYDVVAGINDRLIKIQVKTTRRAHILPGRKNVYGYRFQTSHHGKGGRKIYTKNELDVFALVCLRTKEIGYVMREEAAIEYLTFRSHDFRYRQDDFRDRRELILAMRKEGVTFAEIAKQLKLKSVGHAFHMQKRKTQTFGKIGGRYLSEYTLERLLVKLKVKS